MTVFKWAYIIIGFILLVTGFKTKESGWNLLAIIFFAGALFLNIMYA